MTNELYSLPTTGSDFDSVMADVRTLRSQMTPGQRGKLASTTFQGQEEMSRLTHEAFN